MLPPRRGRARARYLNRGRPAAHDPRVPDDRGPACPGFPLAVLRNLEKIVHPRWPTPLEATKRLVGTFVVMLNITVVFTPIPWAPSSPPW